MHLLSEKHLTVSSSKSETTRAIVNSLGGKDAPSGCRMDRLIPTPWPLRIYFSFLLFVLVVVRPTQKRWWAKGGIMGMILRPESPNTMAVPMKEETLLKPMTVMMVTTRFLLMLSLQLPGGDYGRKSPVPRSLFSCDVDSVVWFKEGTSLMRLGLISHRICIERMCLAVRVSICGCVTWKLDGIQKARDTYHVFLLRWNKRANNGSQQEGYGRGRRASFIDESISIFGFDLEADWGIDEVAWAPPDGGAREKEGRFIVWHR
jgi:hypothetical protein